MTFQFCWSFPLLSKLTRSCAKQRKTSARTVGLWGRRSWFGHWELVFRGWDWLIRWKAGEHPGWGLVGLFLKLIHSDIAENTTRQIEQSFDLNCCWAFVLFGMLQLAWLCKACFSCICLTVGGMIVSWILPWIKRFYTPDTQCVIYVPANLPWKLTIHLGKYTILGSYAIPFKV